ncbi:hypothetical protein [uncultured Ruminococcus sp.]|jgi:hypothetical protein|uniref:DUF7832 domain-containing protein n=1 Tax=uncultured Ruminococcus sp. TaxID=165186 RepID=UPI0025CE2F70|nr:hypothetical protein [uncultured Ruminococcus sp.]MBE6867138.1 hypothetical protein [Ruminococcus albus]
MGKKGSMIKNVLFCVLGVIEALMCIAITGATIAPAEGSGPIEPISAAVALVITAAFLCMISFGGLVREAACKRLNLTSNMLMRLFTLGTGFTALFWCLEDDVHPYEAVAGMLALCIILGIVAILVGRKADKLSPDNSSSSRVHIDNFESDKAEWHWDAAAKEYYRGNVPEDMSDSDNDRIYEYASLPMAYYLLWLLDRDMVSKEFYSLIPADVVSAVRDGRESPVQLLMCTDYCFSKDMISEEVYNFTNVYYWGCFQKSGLTYGYDSLYESYMFDYFHIAGEDRNYYVNSYSNDIREKLEEVLDRRFSEYRDGMVDSVERPGSEFSERYGWEVYISMCKGADDNDLERCIADFKEPSDAKFEKIKQSILNHAVYCYGESEEYDEELFELYNAYNITVYHSEKGEPAYTLSGSCDYDGDEMFNITVRGDIVYLPLLEDEEIPPYSEKMDRVLAILDADVSVGRSVALIPFIFGGSHGAENTVYMPTVCADIKEECDSRIICLVKQGMELDYKCEPKYKDGRAMGFTVSAKDISGRTVFYEKIDIEEMAKYHQGDMT